MFYREKFLGVLLSDNSSLLPSALCLGAGFGSTEMKHSDSVPYALNKQYKARLALQHSGARPLTAGPELPSALAEQSTKPRRMPLAGARSWRSARRHLLLPLCANRRLLQCTSTSSWEKDNHARGSNAPMPQEPFADSEIRISLTLVFGPTSHKERAFPLTQRCTRFAARGEKKKKKELGRYLQWLTTAKNDIKLAENKGTTQKF